MGPLRKLFLAALATTALAAGTPVPADPGRLEHTITFDEMSAFLKSVEKPGLVAVTEEGRSVGGRALYLVHLNRGGTKARFRAFFYAQQHGNEVSGKDAQLCLIRAIAENPERLPEDVDLYLMPMVNPDGAVAKQRRNGAGADLNRDHLLLEQPETQALYRVVRRVQPHLAVDCHEFSRDPEDYTRRGWMRWPLITMDACNHPLIPETLKLEGLRVVESAQSVLARAGYAYARYSVGGPPPDEEIRPSTPEVDDGRNGLGSHGALSFIIEAGVRYGAADPDADLGARADAYLKLFDHLLGTPQSRARIRDLSEEARRAPLPPFIATNVFWANLGGKAGKVKVLERSTGKALDVETPNLMVDLVTKASVPTPRAYAIDPSVAARFLPLLQKHGLDFEVLSAPRRQMAEGCRLLRVEEPYDEVYQRYENRQIVARQPAVERLLPVGTVLVPLNQPLARRAIQVLEPCLLYGLYSYPQFRSLAGPDGTLPILRLP